MAVRRRNEIGVRIALGASKSRIFQMASLEAMILLSCPAIGVILAVCMIPAMRVAGVDPMQVLLEEWGDCALHCEIIILYYCCPNLLSWTTLV